MNPTTIRQICLLGTLEEFQSLLQETNNKLPTHIQLELYENGELAKLQLFFNRSLPCNKLQEKIIADKEIALIDSFSKKWSFDSQFHKKIRTEKHLRIFEMLISNTKLSNEEETNLAKSESAEKNKIYQRYQKPCKKAMEIIKNVRKF
ncbi:MAG: hypothetical protein R3Y43_00205 [Alphaproteobacteria bacterium]